MLTSLVSGKHKDGSKVKTEPFLDCCPSLILPLLLSLLRLILLANDTDFLLVLDNKPGEQVQFAHCALATLDIVKNTLCFSYVG